GSIVKDRAAIVRPVFPQAGRSRPETAMCLKRRRKKPAIGVGIRGSPANGEVRQGRTHTTFLPARRIKGKWCVSPLRPFAIRPRRGRGRRGRRRSRGGRRGGSRGRRRGGRGC